MRLLALLLLTGCGTFVRNDALAGPYYDRCMEKRGADSSDLDDDRACIESARTDAQVDMDEGASTTVCSKQYGNVVCKTREG